MSQIGSVSRADSSPTPSVMINSEQLGHGYTIRRGECSPIDVNYAGQLGPGNHLKVYSVGLCMGYMTHPSLSGMVVAPSESVTAANKELVRIIKENPVAGWDDAWKVGVTPWDSGDVQPPLRDLIKSDELDLPKTGRALIPGCGRGYDASFIASHLGLEALAIDLSPTAIQAARDHFDTIDLGVPSAKVSFEAADFFGLSASDDQLFSLIYDYTFFVAIHPARRGEWGKQISALLKPGGYLITLIYPLNLPPDDDGPPFFVKPEHYVDVLGDGWERVLDNVPENSIPRHEGRERLVVYKKM